MAEGRKTIAQMLARARERITRYSPHQAAAALRAGAIIVDTRDSGDRAREGVIPRAVWIPRNVLEWRADQTSELPDDRLADQEQVVIVMCNDGDSSSLAAASLKELGLDRVGDMSGGYRSWKAFGLPTVPLDQWSEPLR